jgi:hypothetical protein
MQHCTDSLLHYATHYAVTISLHSIHTHHSAMHNTLPHCNTAVLLLLNAGLICLLRVSRVFDSVPVSLLEASRTVSFSQRHWHTGSLAIRGLTGRHFTRCCCAHLKYSKVGLYVISGAVQQEVRQVEKRCFDFSIVKPM